MEPERIANGIVERLREWGVEFNDRAVAAFVKVLPPLGDHPDFDALATRFAEGTDCYAGRRRVAFWMMLMGLVTALLGLLNMPVFAVTVVLVNGHTGGQLNLMPWALWAFPALLLLIGGFIVMVIGQIMLSGLAPRKLAERRRR